MDKTREFISVVENSNNIVFFGGAGVSTESNIPDFRSPDGLYNQKYKYPPEYILSHDFFMTHTEEFFEFYRDKMLVPWAKPNVIHKKLAALEKLGKLRCVITQNIDGLHEMAGSKNVLNLHGTVYKNHCMKCGEAYPMEYILESKGVPKCRCGGTIKPDVVLYGECLDEKVLEKSILRKGTAGKIMNSNDGSRKTNDRAVNSARYAMRVAVKYWRILNFLPCRACSGDVFC